RFHAAHAVTSASRRSVGSVHNRKIFMWIRNLQLYRLPSPWNIDAEALQQQLSRRAFQPCGSQDQQSRGWVSPCGDDRLVHRVDDLWLIALGVEQRLLPASVVKQEAEERAE